MATKPPQRRAPRAKPAAPQSRSVKPPTPAARAKRSQPAAPKTKLDALIAALAAPKGATLARLMAATGWQAHSVRGALSGALKKKRGLIIASTKEGSVRVYRITSRP